MKVAVTICGRVVDRSGGLQPNSASRIMDQHPKWKDFVQSIEGWNTIEPGTLTLDNCTPLPNATLDSIECLATEPKPEEYFEGDPQYVALMRRRGERRYYRGLARSKSRSHPVLVSQQRNPACNHRLEVYSDSKLRDILKVETRDYVWVDIDSDQTRVK